MTNLLELADRVEVGADSVLDQSIGDILWQDQTDQAPRNVFDCYQPYTTSLDAALTLVPEGCWAEGSLGQHDGTRSSIEIHAPMTYDPIGRATAPTPARALTASALRARAEMVK